MAQTDPSSEPLALHLATPRTPSLLVTFPTPRTPRLEPYFHPLRPDMPQITRKRHMAASLGSGRSGMLNLQNAMAINSKPLKPLRYLTAHLAESQPTNPPLPLCSGALDNVPEARKAHHQTLIPASALSVWHQTQGRYPFPALRSESTSLQDFTVACACDCLALLPAEKEPSPADQTKLETLLAAKASDVPLNPA